MARVLFVEDNLRMVQELVRMIQNELPEWRLDFACDIPEAWEKLCANVYDGIVLDIMLPSWPAAPERSEGIYLAKWILIPATKPDSLHGHIKSNNENTGVVFLTSRTESRIETSVDEAFRNTKLKDKKFDIIIRSEGDAKTHLTEIKKAITQSQSA